MTSLVSLEMTFLRTLKMQYDRKLGGQIALLHIVFKMTQTGNAKLTFQLNSDSRTPISWTNLTLELNTVLSSSVKFAKSAKIVNEVKHINLTLNLTVLDHSYFKKWLAQLNLTHPHHLGVGCVKLVRTRVSEIVESTSPFNIIQDHIRVSYYVLVLNLRIKREHGFLQRKNTV